MTTRRLSSLLQPRNLWPCALILAILLPGLALADTAESKTPEDKPAAEKPEPKSAPEKPAADKPEPKSAGDEPAEKKPEPAEKKPDPKPAPDKPAEKKPEAKPAEKQKPKPAENKPAAEKPKPKPTEAKPAEDKPAEEKPEPKPVDVNIELMGEFVGTVAVGRNRFQQLGLQIRSTGGRSFEAAQYLGGLPTLRPRPRPPTMLIGKRHEDFLVLSGGPWAVLVERDHCLLIDRQGKQMGRLERVKRESPTMGAEPPKGAIVLFDGAGTEQFTEAQITEDGLLMEGAFVKPLFNDFNLHLEFLLPYMPTGTGQGRGNSGVYLQSRYEVQVLDSFALVPQANDCGGLYRFRPPDVNMCFPPLVWQTYEIMFTSPRWNSDGTKRQNAKITVWHNGVKIHNNVELPDKTGAGKPEELIPLPIRLQNHKDPVRFRNIWIIDRGDAPPTRFPPRPKPAGGDKS